MDAESGRTTRGEAAQGGPRIGLALGGGGARGLAHIVVLEVFDELGLRPSVIAGTSIGAVVGAAYAAGMSGEDLREFTLQTFRRRGEVLARIWRVRSGNRMAGILAPTLANPAQLNAERFLAAFLPEQVPPGFSDLDIPLTAVASDFYGWRPVGLNSGDLLRAIAASIAIPGMFRPVVVDGRVMVDGGVTDPLPFGYVREDADILIAVDVVNGPKPGNPGRVPSSFESVLGAMQLLMQTVIADKIAQYPPDVLVRPEISIFRVLDFMKARAIFRACEPIKDDLKRQLDRVLRDR